MKSLQELLDFYEQYLCDRQFVYPLKSGQPIKLVFFRESFCHLLGLQHIARDKKILGKRGYRSILSGKLTLQSLKKRNKAGYRYIENRLRYFPLTKELLLHGELFRFYPERVNPPSKIRATMLLYNQTEHIYLYLFLAEENPKNNLFTPLSFIPLTDKDDQPKRYILYQEHKICLERTILLTWNLWFLYPQLLAYRISYAESAEIEFITVRFPVDRSGGKYWQGFFTKKKASPCEADSFRFRT